MHHHDFKFHYVLSVLESVRLRIQSESRLVLGHCLSPQASQWLPLHLADSGILEGHQFLVQQRHFKSSIEQVPARADSICTSHPRSGPLKGTTKRCTRGKDSSKKNNKHKAYNIIALRCELEGLKEKIRRSASSSSRGDSGGSSRGKSKGVQGEVSYTRTWKKKAVERDLRAA